MIKCQNLVGSSRWVLAPTGACSPYDIVIQRNPADVVVVDTTITHTRLSGDVTESFPSTFTFQDGEFLCQAIARGWPLADHCSPPTAEALLYGYVLTFHQPRMWDRR